MDICNCGLIKQNKVGTTLNEGGIEICNHCLKPATMEAAVRVSTGSGQMLPAVTHPAKSAAGIQPARAAHGASYVVLQVILKEKLWGTGSGNLTELEKALNAQASLGYRLHTITTAASGSKGLGGGDRIQATMVFERLM